MHKTRVNTALNHTTQLNNTSCQLDNWGQLENSTTDMTNAQARNTTQGFSSYQTDRTRPTTCYSDQTNNKLNIKSTGSEGQVLSLSHEPTYKCIHLHVLCVGCVFSCSRSGLPFYNTLDG